jgi:hypothetical protein
LVLASLLGWGLLFILLSLHGAGGGLARILGCSSEDVRVGFLQLREHFLAVLGLLQFTLESLNLHKDLVFKRVVDDVDDLLKDVVTKDMSHKFTNNQIHTHLGLARAITELIDNCHVIPKVGAQEDLGNLHGGLRSLESLLNHI